MLQLIDLCKFRPKQAYTLTLLHLWPPLDGTHERKRGERFYNKQETHMF